MKMDIEKVARLARLELSEEEKITLGSQLEQILNYMEQLSRLDTTGVEPTSRLELSEKEKVTLGSQLEQILNYMEQLNRLDTTGVEPTSHAIPLSNVFKEDEVKPSIPHEEVLAIAPEEEAGHFKVPKIIE